MRAIGWALAAALMAALALGAADARAAGTDLGIPNYAGYCVAHGYQSSMFILSEPQSWTCKSANGTLAPLDIQAACEYTFPGRAVQAVQTIPGAQLSWHCYTPASAGEGGSSPAPGVGGTPPTQLQLTAELSSALVPHGPTARIGALLKRGWYYARINVHGAGALSIAWYVVPRGARIAGATPMLVASGRVSYASAGTVTLRVKLTTRGRKLLKRAKRLKLTAKGTFTDSGVKALTQLKSFTLSR
jgi:hypothetical protein